MISLYISDFSILINTYQQDNPIENKENVHEKLFKEIQNKGFNSQSTWLLYIFIMRNQHIRYVNTRFLVIYAIQYLKEQSSKEFSF